MRDFLLRNHVAVETGVELKGRSGLVHSFDFAMPAGKKEPEGLIEVLGQPTREKIRSLLFAWNDIRQTRPAQLVLYAILNDTRRKVPRDISDALALHQIQVLRWKERDRVLEVLSS